MNSNLFYICLAISIGACIGAEDPPVTAIKIDTSTEAPTSPTTAKPTDVTVPTSNVTVSTTTLSPATNFSCAICRSDNTKQADCGSNDVGTKYNKYCELQPGTNTTLEACYILRTQSNVVFRDCYTTAVALNLPISEETCKQTLSNCVFCNKTNCNFGKPPNSAANLKISLSGPLVAVLALIVSKYL